MVYIVVRTDGITSRVYILFEIFVFGHPMESGEFVDISELFYFIGNRISRIVPVYVNVYGFGRMELGSKQVVINSPSCNSAK